MNPYLEALQPKLSPQDFQKLSALDNPNVHEFIAKASDLCHPEKIFICSDSAEDIAYVRKQAVTVVKNKQSSPCRGTQYTLTVNKTKDRDRQNTKYLVPKGVILSKALNQMDRQEGLTEVRGVLRELMAGKTMIVRFISLGPS